MPGIFERTIVDDVRAARKRRIVLREDRELGLAGQAREHGRDQLAGRALSLDERDEPRRERRSGRHEDPSSIYAADEARVKMMRRRRAPTLYMQAVSGGSSITRFSIDAMRSISILTTSPGQEAGRIHGEIGRAHV